MHVNYCILRRNSEGKKASYTLKLLNINALSENVKDSRTKLSLNNKKSTNLLFIFKSYAPTMLKLCLYTSGTML